jgi:hypothetical protein
MATTSATTYIAVSQQMVILLYVNYIIMAKCPRFILAFFLLILFFKVLFFFSPSIMADVVLTAVQTYIEQN